MAMLAKAREAMGGAAKLAAVKDMTQVDTMQLDAAAGGLKATQTDQWIAPDKYRQDNVLAFGKVATYSDSKAGWMATPQGVQNAPEPQLKQIQFETFRIWFRLMLSEKAAALPDGKVQISDNEGHDVIMTFDPATGLPATESYTGNITETYSDWQETNGIKLPRKNTLTREGHHYADVTVTEISLNKGLTEAEISKKP